MSCNMNDQTERKQRSEFRTGKTEVKAKYAGYANDAEWIKLRTALMRVLRQHPAARMAVIEAIETNRGWIPDEEGGDAEPDRV